MLAHAGIQRSLNSLGSRLRGNDEITVNQRFPKSVTGPEAWPVHASLPLTCHPVSDIA